jgi:hypothetical protein
MGESVGETSIFFGVTEGGDSTGGGFAEGKVVLPNGYTDVMRSGPFGRGYMPEGEYVMYRVSARTSTRCTRRGPTPRNR